MVWFASNPACDCARLWVPGAQRCRPETWAGQPELCHSDHVGDCPARWCRIARDARCRCGLGTIPQPAKARGHDGMAQTAKLLQAHVIGAPAAAPSTPYAAQQLRLRPRRCECGSPFLSCPGSGHSWQGCGPTVWRSSPAARCHSVSTSRRPSTCAPPSEGSADQA